MPPPLQPLPVHPRFADSSPDEYIASLLEFWSDSLLQTLCGGVHILDFFTRDLDDGESKGEGTLKDIYRTVLPPDWVAYFAPLPIEDVLDLLLRTPLDEFAADVPPTLKAFVKNVREHSLQRGFVRREKSERTKKTTRYGTEWALNMGMKPKKIHEVENFAAFLDELVRDIRALDETKAVTHVVDYGAGQAYLSRMVAKKYGHNVVGIESRDVNIIGAKALDEAFDKLALRKLRTKRRKNEQHSPCKDGECIAEEDHVVGSLQYVQTFISDGNIDEVVNAIHDIPAKKLADIKPTPVGRIVVESHTPDASPAAPKSLLLTSLHSCGNLVHHALAAFKNTPAVRAVALIGCCYNLMTEKQGASFKPPYLRNPHPRLIKTSTAGDPQGFPISKLLTDRDIKLNITARSMACQAPTNWTAETCADFFQRHFYRALLQRIFLDRGMVDPNSDDPIIIGSLKKGSFDSFTAYVQAATKKLGWADRIEVTQQDAETYIARFWERKKELAIVWSLMAFAASVVESIIIVDRLQFLREMGCKQAWVEAAFEYSESPRNFVVVGVR